MFTQLQYYMTGTILWIFNKWDSKCAFWENVLPQLTHRNCFSTPHSNFRCFLRLASCLYLRPQWLGQKRTLVSVVEQDLRRPENAWWVLTEIGNTKVSDWWNRRNKDNRKYWKGMDLEIQGIYLGNMHYAHIYIPPFMNHCGQSEW